jgi:hypothetical protein
MRLPTGMLALSCGVLVACGSSGDDGPIPVADPGCPARSELECARDVGHALPLRVEGNTTAQSDDFGNLSCGLGGATIPDAAFRWTAPRNDTYTVSTEGSSFDTVLSVRSGSCFGRELACNEDAGEQNTHSEVTVQLSQCQTITVVVDGRGVEATGGFRLSITGTERMCGDGRDGDGDGKTDCEDSDCRGTEACLEQGDWPVEWGRRESGMLEEVNRRRTEGAVCGGEQMPPVDPLEMDPFLREAARRHSKDMAEQGYFAHQSPDGRTLDDRLEAVEFPGARPWGENIAASDPDPVRTVESFMQSPDHCRNIMNGSYGVIGIGYAQGGPAGHYWTQDFGGSH